MGGFCQSGVKGRTKRIHIVGIVISIVLVGLPHYIVIGMSEWGRGRITGYRNQDVLVPYQDPYIAKSMTCLCADEENASVCASNGIRYKNWCQFHCARSRDLGLRVMVDRFCRKFYYAGYRYGWWLG